MTVRDDGAPECRTVVFCRDLRRALRVAAGVGTALVALNQGDVLLGALRGAPLPPALVWKIPLTFVVPLLVSFGSSRAAARDARSIDAA